MNVRRAYEVLYGSGNPLCVSLDTVFFDNSPKPFSSDGSVRLTAHTDLNSHLVPEGFGMVQSILYVWPADELCSTTAVWPGSHGRVYAEHMRGYGKEDGHYCLMKAPLDAFVASACRLQIPAGAMLMFDSRTMHQGWNGGPRLAMAICMEPASHRSHEAFMKKKALVVNGVCATHWASTGRTHARTQKLKDLPKRLEGEEGGVFLRHVAHRAALEADSVTVREEILDLL